MRPPTRSAVALLIVALVASIPLAGTAAAQQGDEDSVTTPSKLVSNEQFDEIGVQLSGLIDAAAPDPLLDAATIDAIAGSPVGPSLAYLVTEFVVNPAVEPALNAVVAGLNDLPSGYSGGNPWQAASSGRDLLQLLVDEFLTWGVFLPQISGDIDDGLFYIERIAWLVYLNEAGQDFVQGRDPINGGTLEIGEKFLKDFTDQRGAFMWSPASTAMIEQWVADPRIEIEDYEKTEASDFSSFNDFFARNITIDEETQTIPSRPATMPLSQFPERDYIVVAPTDCIMNALVQVLVDDAEIVRQTLDNQLQYNTVLDVKGIPLRIDKLLGSLEEDIKQQFVGGTGLSCVLMPNTYHFFHAPVNGTVVHSEVIEANTFGIFDFPNFAPTDGNVGRAGTDFGQFEVFERGVIVIEVKYQNVDDEELTGYVASIPVGLATIGSVVLDDAVKPGLEVKRGYTRLGNFYYGGSLNILLFSKGLATGAVQTRLGNQIAVFDVGSEPALQ
ncbi:MAG: phosphatidylserine decarboxylase [Chloroflexota bacterium]